MDPATRSLLTSLASSFLLLVAFLVLSLLAVALYMVWRGLGVAAPELERLAGELRDQVQLAEVRTHRTARRVIQPQIYLTSAWVGLKVGLRTLVAGEDGSSGPKPPEEPA